MFVEDQCHENAHFDEPLSNAMANAFKYSKAVRIGWTKIILSHPMCVFWYHRRGGWGSDPFDGYTILHRDAADAESERWNSNCYRLTEVLSLFQYQNNMEFVMQWRSQVDWIWHCLEETSNLGDDGGWYHYIMLFVDNVDESGQCGMFVGTVQESGDRKSGNRKNSTFDYDSRNRDNAFLCFDRHTPCSEFRDLFVAPHRDQEVENDYFEFVHPPYWYDLRDRSWGRYCYEEQMNIDRIQNPLHCLQYFYPLVRDR